MDRGRGVALTFDDVPVITVARDERALRDATTAALLDELRRRGIPAVGFVNECQLTRGGRLLPEEVALLERWLAAGMELGNHTWSHGDLHRMTVDEFTDDVVRGETVTAQLIAAHGGTLRWFRHPYLDTGRTAAERDAVDTFLAGRGYRVAPVTIYPQDHWFSAAWDWARDGGRERDAAGIERSYLEHFERGLDYAERVTAGLFGGDIAHVLLLHANPLNAHLLPVLLDRVEARGNHFTTLDQVLTDPAYGSVDEYLGSGVAWLERWARTRGIDSRAFAASPEVPLAVRLAARTPLRRRLRLRVHHMREFLYARLKRPWLDYRAAWR